MSFFVDNATLIGSLASAIALVAAAWAVVRSGWRRLSQRQTPPALEVVEKWVDIKYPSDSGLQARLEAEGYNVGWCSDKHLARKVDLKGWEIVVEPNADGVPSKFRLETRPANQTLVKKRLST